MDNTQAAYCMLVRLLSYLVGKVGLQTRSLQFCACPNSPVRTLPTAPSATLEDNLCANRMTNSVLMIQYYGHHMTNTMAGTIN